MVDRVMKAERWDQMERLYHAAAEADEAARRKLLEEADPDVRREVESMLAQRGTLLDGPAWEAFPQTGAGPLESGVFLGRYRLEDRIGQGGMSEVFRARDSFLRRDVAVKILREGFDERFVREVRAISALNHPHICTVYDAGPNFLVMELLDGRTLAERLKDGKLDVEETLRYGSQIADGLAAAHSKGIIHRDLKPGNIMLTKSGAKVLDFGIAKSVDDETLTRHSLVGTPAYMAPEQRDAMKCDARTDIYSFGLVLHEMAVGRRAAAGQPATLDGLPAALANVIRGCLEPDPESRWQSAADLHKQLSLPAPTDAVRQPASRAWLWTACAVVVIAIALFVGLRLWLRTPPEVVRFNVLPPEGNNFGGAPGPAISPDGRRLLFVTTSKTGYRLWLRDLAMPDPVLVRGGEGSSYPFWSPDSKSIAFFTLEGKLSRIDLDAPSGPSSPRVLCDAPAYAGGSWSRNGTIIFATQTGLLYRVPATGGAPAIIARHNADGSVIPFRFPSFLPDGEHFLFESTFTPSPVVPAPIRVGSLSSPDTKIVAEANSNATFARGQLLYVRDHTLVAQPFDPKRLATAGDPAPVADQVAVFTGLGNFSATERGPLVYTGNPESLAEIAWFDFRGARLPAPAFQINPGYYMSSPSLSPDAKHIAVDRVDDNKSAIWIYDAARATGERFTFDNAIDVSPVWSRDGKSILFASRRKGRFEIYRKSVDSPGGEELLLADGNDNYPYNVSPDTQFLLFNRHSDQVPQMSVWVLPLTGGAKPFPLLDAPVSENNAEFSPDGKWVAYESTESGRSQIYLAPFRAGGPTHAAHQIVTPSDSHTPRWRRAGTQIVSYSPQHLTVVNVNLNDGLTGKTAADIAIPDGAVWGYQLAPEGDRFLAKIRSPGTATRPIVVVQNWLLTLASSHDSR
jgi:eukaryotic-like serine/threonine-protein kinase